MKFQAIVLASFLVMPYALADDQGGLTTGPLGYWVMLFVILLFTIMQR